MSDFSDRPFVAGTVVGLRAFGVDRLGRLHGPSFDQVFKPGENVAACRKGDSNYYMPMFSTSGMFASTWIAPPPSEALRRALGLPAKNEVAPSAGLSEDAVAIREAAKPKHVVAGLGCSCGFYAYFDGRNDYKDPQRISAIIEGYGVCTVGDRGFRAEKARLLGLIVPGKRFSPQLLARVAHNYSDVPFYGSKREALDAHPLTVADVPTPETCDDFWERDAR